MSAQHENRQSFKKLSFKLPDLDRFIFFSSVVIFFYINKRTQIHVIHPHHRAIALLALVKAEAICRTLQEIWASNWDNKKSDLDLLLLHKTIFMQHWVQRYNRVSKGVFSSIWQSNLFTEDSNIGKDLILTSPFYTLHIIAATYHAFNHFIEVSYCLLGCIGKKKSQLTVFLGGTEG